MKTLIKNKREDVRIIYWQYLLRSFSGYLNISFSHVCLPIIFIFTKKLAASVLIISNN